MSLIGQLSTKEQGIPRFVRKLYHDHAGSTVLPSVQFLQEIMLRVISLHSSCFIVLDGVDECSNVQETLEVINALRRHDIGGPRNPCILITSRKLYEIQAALIEAHRDESTIEISLDTRPTAHIERFIESELEKKHRISRQLSPELKRQISTALSEKADGMFVSCNPQALSILKNLAVRFLWVRLVLDEIHRVPTIKAVKKTIVESLPPTLNQIYEEMLLKVPPQNIGMVRRILIWIMNSARPLTIDEVRDGIISNTIGESVDIDDRLINSDDILRICSGMLVEATEVNDDTGKPQTILRLAHFSLMQFFRSKHMVGPFSDLRDIDGDRILAHCCLTYLLTFNEGSPQPNGDLSDFPLLAYAAEYWPYHAQRIEDAQSWHSDTTRLVMRLFRDNNGSSFSNWLNLFDPAASSRSVASTQGVDTSNSPLFYASLLGLRHVLTLLLDSKEKKLGPELEAGLFEASCKGFADIVHILLEQGVNPNTEHSSGGRPLDVAILNSHKAIVELLLQYDANVNYENGIIGSPFRTAVHTSSTTGNVALADLLLRTTKAEMPPEAFLETLGQGLREAARLGNLDVVQLLFNADESGDLDAADKSGWTALHYAIRFKHDGVQQYLIDHGANINRRNLAGETPADFAWSDRRLDLSVYNMNIDLEKTARHAVSCHILQQVSDSGECQKVR